MLSINCKDVSLYIFLWSHCFLCDTLLSFCHVAWKSRHVGQFLIIPSVPAFMLTQYMDSCANSLVFSIPMWFRSSCLSALCCSAVGTIILLPFIAIPSITAILSLNDQNSCSSFCNLAFADGQLWSTSSDIMPRNSSSIVAILISSAVM